MLEAFSGGTKFLFFPFSFPWINRLLKRYLMPKLNPFPTSVIIISVQLRKNCVYYLFKKKLTKNRCYGPEITVSRHLKYQPKYSSLFALSAIY